MGVSPDYACPIIVRLYSTRDLASEEFIDARAHDIHCAGYLLFLLLTGVAYFTPDGSVGNSAEAVCAFVHQKQMSWVSHTTLPLP